MPLEGLLMVQLRRSDNDVGLGLEPSAFQLGFVKENKSYYGSFWFLNP